MFYARTKLEELELTRLNNYACKSAYSKGRFYTEIEDTFRTCFQRDRDRIIHSKAFRRLNGKTQVFVAHHGDHYRSRLTHSIEVAQISRDICRSLGLNEDLAESIALAHDLGHTPFGHAGEMALHHKMQAFNQSFEHNQQSVRIVTELETRSTAFTGLNLSQEIIEGLVKHKSAYDQTNNNFSHLASLEAQIVNLADEIAYQNHDLDDGYRSGILKLADLEKLTLWQEANQFINHDLVQKSMLNQDVWVARNLGKLMELMVNEVITETQKNILQNKIGSFADIADCKNKLVSFSSIFEQKNQELKQFLFNNFYRSKNIMLMNNKGEKIISALFDFFIANPNKLPLDLDNGLQLDKNNLIIKVKDYIAGMTDNFAEEIYNKRSVLSF